MDKEQKAIMRLQEGEMMSKQYYKAPLMICYSGGKDSDVLVQLAINSGIDFEVVHNHTTADAPETVRYITERFKEWESKGNKNWHTAEDVFRWWMEENPDQMRIEDMYDV